MQVETDNVSHDPTVTEEQPISSLDHQRRDFTINRYSQHPLKIGDTVHISFTPFEANNTTTHIKGEITAASTCYNDGEFVGHCIAIKTKRNTRYTIVTHDVDKYDSVIGKKEELMDNDKQYIFYGCDVEIHTPRSWEVAQSAK